MAVFARILPRLSSSRLMAADQKRVFVARKTTCPKPTLRYGAVNTSCVASTNRPGSAHIPMDVHAVLP